MIDSDWKSEVHRYIDEGIDAHNTANQKEFKLLHQAIRDGRLKTEADISSTESRLTEKIDSAESRLTEKIESVRAASETAHKSILETLDDIIARLDRLEKRG